jgi:hypothetical protein
MVRSLSTPPLKMARCQITVLKRTVNLDDEYEGVGLCDCFRDAQEMVIED